LNLIEDHKDHIDEMLQEENELMNDHNIQLVLTKLLYDYMTNQNHHFPMIDIDMIYYIKYNLQEVLLLN
jgi:hypothetical protein